MGFVCDVLSHSATLRIIWEFEGWKYLFYQLKYLMLRKNSFTRYDLPTHRLPYTATNSDYLIEIFGRGVPSPLFFRLSFLLPFNSIYTVANRKKTNGKFSAYSQTIAIFAEFNSFGIDTMAHLIYFRYRECGEAVLCPKCYSTRNHPGGMGWVFRLIEWLRKNQSLY